MMDITNLQHYGIVMADFNEIVKKYRKGYKEQI